MATTSGPALILDSWAWIEEVFDGPRRPEVDEVRRAASRVVTVRDVLVETYSFILRRTRPAVAREWWDVVRESRLTILEPSLDDLDSALAKVPPTLGLSVVDASLVWAAEKTGIHRIATSDRAFAAVGLQPLFA